MKQRTGYIKAANLFAHLLVIFGGFGFLIGLGVATGIIVEPEPSRYLGSKTSGEAIDRGLYLIAVGIMVGAISEIGMALTKSNNAS